MVVFSPMCAHVVVSSSSCSALEGFSFTGSALEAFYSACCATWARPASLRATSLPDFLFSVLDWGASVIRSLKDGLYWSSAGVPRMATRGHCIVVDHMCLCLCPVAFFLSIVCPLPSCHLHCFSLLHLCLPRYTPRLSPYLCSRCLQSCAVCCFTSCVSYVRQYCSSLVCLPVFFVHFIKRKTIFPATWVLASSLLTHRDISGKTDSLYLTCAEHSTRRVIKLKNHDHQRDCY